MSRPLVGTVAILASLSGCEFGGDLPPDLQPDDSDTPGAGGEPENGSGGAGGALTPEERVRLPFAVADHFVPFGYMGAGTEGKIVDHPNDCLERPSGAQGKCYSFTFTPEGTVAEWGGVYWLSEADNWGERPGRLVEAGARQVRFRAAASRPGATVRFLVGGIAAGEAFSDEFSAQSDLQLTSELSTYSIDLTNAEYEAGVLGGFGWSTETDTPVKVWLDDIRWE